MSNTPTDYIELRQQRDFSAVISTGFQFVRQNWKALYRPLFFICLPIYLLASVLFGSFFRSFYGNALAGNQELMMTGMMGSMGSMFLGYVLMALSMLLLYAIIYEFMRYYMENKGQTPGMGELWKVVRGQLVSYFVIGFLAGIIATFGMVLFIIPGIWLAIVFTMAFPLHAFERTDIGDSIGRSFKVIKGRWWMTFSLVIVLAMLIGFISYIIYLPFMLLTGLGAMSGIGSMDDPAAMGERMGWLMTLMMVLGGVVNVIFQPLLHVPIGLHALSLIEEKEGRGLLQRVDDLNTARPTA
ncbi:MAG: hypothetical protein K8H89_03835 [Flavobacteriales bacterium]|jgi:hypothetical protein|nr:hypothetical protein [Flavobacteriales bacterium]MCB0759185.1 hypothetical protein [Flavobacteriales bacterium]